MKKRSLDVARLMVRTDKKEAVHMIRKVSINGVSFSIKMVEDWFGPIQWGRSQNQSKHELYNDESSSSDGDAWPESWSEDDAVEEEDEAVGYGNNSELNEALIGKSISNSNEGNKELTTKSGNKESGEDFVEETKDHSKDNLLCWNSAGEFMKQLESQQVGEYSATSHVSATRGSGGCKENYCVDSSENVENSFGPIVSQPPIMEAMFFNDSQNQLGPVPNNTSSPIEERLSSIQRNKETSSQIPILRVKQKKLSKRGFLSKPRRASHLNRVTHELKSISHNSTMNEAPVMSRTATDQDSTHFSGGSVLCCGSLSSSDVRFCNNKFWALQSKSVAQRVWEEARRIGVEGTEEDEVYIQQINLGESRDAVAKQQRVNNNGVS